MNITNDTHLYDLYLRSSENFQIFPMMGKVRIGADGKIIVGLSDGTYIRKYNRICFEV